MNHARFRRAAALAASIAVPLVVLCAGAAAQTPAAPAPAAMPKANCGDKPEHPGRLASTRQKNQWVREANAYTECLRKFAEEQTAAVERARAAANAAIQGYNDAVKDINAQAAANAD